MFPVNGWPISAQELAFVQSLFEDLGQLGLAISIDGDRLRVTQTVPSSTVDYRQFYGEAHRQLHRKIVTDRLSAILEFEHHYGPSVFVEGKDLELRAIDPYLRAVDLTRRAHPTPRDLAIVDYLRSYQTVASRQSVGRENVYILEDYGHAKRPVMGVLVLASSRFYQPHRDELLGWLSPNELKQLSQRRQKKAQRIRLAGLNRTMQVAVCCALPPYSTLGAASLLAVAPFVSTIQDDFKARWRDKRSNKDPDLVAVTTTTSMGLTGTPFQALYVSMFFDQASSDPKGAKWNDDNTIYSRLGNRHPWLDGVRIRAQDPLANFQPLLSVKTWNLALAVAGPAIDAKRREYLLQRMSPQFRGRLLRHVIERLGLSNRIFHGNPVGIFLGAVDKPALEALKEGRPRQLRPLLSWSKAVSRFKSEFDTEQADRCADSRRSQAVRERANRALKTTLSQIRLSTHSGPVG
jgi:hypothetical protein